MKTKIFATIFIVVVILELFFGSFEQYYLWHYFTKPAIVISLMLFFIFNADHLSFSIKLLTMLGLLFSLWGDVLLLFASNSEGFFIAGLIAFLLAHVMYIFVFIRDRNSKNNIIPLLITLFLYAIVLLWIIKDGLGSLLIPVLVYMGVILVMTVSAFLRKGMVIHRGYVYVCLGAVFFMLSDSLLAVNKFHNPLPLAHVSIMSTYAVAQFLIVLGIINSYKR